MSENPDKPELELKPEQEQENGTLDKNEETENINPTPPTIQPIQVDESKTGESPTKTTVSRETTRSRPKIRNRPVTLREKSVIKDDNCIKPGTAELNFTLEAEREKLALKEQAHLQREHSKLKYPPQVIKMSTVSMSARPRPQTQDLLYSSRSNYVDSKNNPQKLVTWEEATNCRPPLRIDLDGPTPCSYSPQNKPLYETNAPSYSFGRKTFVEKRGGSRTSWEKTWFQNSHLWHQKADFHSERTWPSPPQYEQPPTLGPRQITNQGFPAYSIGVRRAMTINKKGSEKEPSPNEYNIGRSDVVLLKKAPSFSHGLRRGGTVLWSSSEGYSNPGPGAYEPEHRFTKNHNPAFTIRGIRRDKIHELGPFASF